MYSPTSVLTLPVLRQVEQNVLALLRQSADRLLPSEVMTSPRAVGDAVQEFLATHLPSCFPEGALRNFESDFERRSMEDMAFYDSAGCYYAVDVKTHNAGTRFNMPNLISVQRLARFYENDTNTFMLLIVGYEVRPEGLHYQACHFRPIEHFSWQGLRFGALGWGQIQIADTGNLAFEAEPSRREWMLQLCDNVQAFYDVEVGKLSERRSWFDKVRQRWQQSPARI